MEVEASCPMPDPISGPIDFGFIAFSIVLMLWIAIDTRRVLRMLEFLHSRTKPLSPAVIRSISTLAAFCACGLFAALVTHLVRSR